MVLVGLPRRNHDQHRDPVDRRHPRKLLRRRRNRLDHPIFQLATVFLPFRAAHVLRRPPLAPHGRPRPGKRMARVNIQKIRIYRIRIVLSSYFLRK